ncbi:hypothetical protein V2J09_005441 [Rumex salicifolius]
MELIPGLPNDLARECLSRLPFESFPFLLPVCKSWNDEIRSPDFHQRRRLSGLTRPVFILTQRDRVTHSHSIRLFDPDRLGFCSRLPPIPDLPFEAPTFGGVVAVGSSSILVVSCGWERLVDGDLRFVNVVHVFEFLTGQWRRAADMPSHPDMWYGLGVCADPVHRKVLVAGGYGGQSRALNTAVMYDVASDEWTCLDDMTEGKQSCSVVFHVIGGYSPALSYNQMTCAESLDPETSRWGPIKEGFLEEGSENASYTLVVQANRDGDLYSVGQSVKVRRGGGDTWEEVTRVPREAWSKKGVVTWKDKMLVLGGELSHVGPSYNYLLDLKTYEWISVDMVNGYSDSIIKGYSIDASDIDLFNQAINRINILAI